MVEYWIVGLGDVLCITCVKEQKNAWYISKKFKSYKKAIKALRNFVSVGYEAKY